MSAVINHGSDKWDGPTTLHEMLNTRNDHILRHIPNYFINLFSPADFRDEDFQKFNTNLGFAMDAVRRTKKGIAEFILRNKGKEIDQQSAIFINEFADLNLKCDDSDSGRRIDMCEATEEYTLKTKALAYIDSYRSLDLDDDEIVKMVVKQLGVTTEYVELMMTLIHA